MCFVWIWEQTAIISLYSINWLVCITQTECLLRGTDWVFIYNSTFCPHSVFMCFVWIWEQTAIISLYSINWLVCKMRWSVYCAVRAASLIVISVKMSLQLLRQAAADSSLYTHDTLQHSVWCQKCRQFNNTLKIWSFPVKGIQSTSLSLILNAFLIAALSWRAVVPVAQTVKWLFACWATEQPRFDSGHGQDINFVSKIWKPAV